MRRLTRHLVPAVAAILAHGARGDQEIARFRASAPEPDNGGRLATVVPVHEGDVAQALASLAQWPNVCSPTTLAKMDLVLYKAEQPGKSSARIQAVVEETAGRCFANTKVVHGNLLPEVR